MILVRSCERFGVCAPRAFDVHEVALTFVSSAHQGDKRKTSQQCVSAPLFVETKELPHTYIYVCVSVLKVLRSLAALIRALSSASRARCWGP